MLVLSAQAFAGDTGSGWISFGHDPANTRNQPLEHEITPSNVGQLALKWVATTTGDVSATPAVSGVAVYSATSGHAVEARRGDGRRDLVAPGAGLHGDRRRLRADEPVARRELVVVGTNKTPLLLGVDATTGALLWKTQVNPDPHGTMTGRRRSSATRC